MNGLLIPEVQAFIRANESADVSELLLGGKFPEGADPALVADQILARRKAKNKLPELYGAAGILFPPPLSVEQASTAETALYKASLIQADMVTDLTGGTGIDCVYFSRAGLSVTYVEQQELLVACFRHNARILDLQKVTAVHADGTVYLQSMPPENNSLIYLDPARRNGRNKKVAALADCQPNVAGLLPLLLQKAPVVLIKLSPMLDIKAALQQLGPVKEVHVVAVKNDCKELLFLLERGFTGVPEIHTVNLEPGGKSSAFTFTLPEEKEAVYSASPVLSVLYEPDVALLKAGAFKTVARRFDLQKLDLHTHLYTADKVHEEFPGKIYKVLEVFPPAKKEVQKRLKDLKVSIKSRNFPESADALRRKYRLKDGTDRYVFFCTVNSKKQVIITEKLISGNTQ